MPYQCLDRAQVKRLFRCHSQIHELYSLSPDLRSVHVLIHLAEGIGCLMPLILRGLVPPQDADGRRPSIHIHAVAPGVEKEPSSFNRWCLQTAAWNLGDLRETLQSNKLPVVVWVLGGTASENPAAAAEAVILLSRMGIEPPSAPWIESTGIWKKPNEMESVRWGTYRVAWQDRDSSKDAVGWLDGFPEVRIPAHRRDSLSRIATGWNLPVASRERIQSTHPDWLVDDRSSPHCSSWCQAQFWLDLSPEEVRWWQAADSTGKSSERATLS
jgi:hypothetical protein